MARQLDPINSRLLDMIQAGIPLVERPFAELAQSLGVDESQVLARIAELKSPPHPIIRQISAIFDTRALGYRGSLVAAKVPEEQVESAAAAVNRHPGVSHNYLRNHAYNLWYTVAVGPDSRLGLEKTIDILHRESGATVTRLMPTLKLFKIGVKLNLGGEADLTAQSDAPRFSETDRAAADELPPLTPADVAVIRVLQQDLPIVPRPCDAWAAQAGMCVEDLLSAARSFESQRRMRRFSAVLHHREAGFSANGMGVWIVPPEHQERFGEAAGRFDAVSHCYLRPTYEDWPYNMFTMVHARDRDGCEAVLAAISGATGVTQYKALYSTKEYKKVRVRYFTGEAEAWEEEMARRYPGL